MLYLGADHAGFELKEAIKEFLKLQEIPFEDLSAGPMVPGDDYPVVTEKLSRKVLADPANRGVLLCANGVGVCMAANKHPGIRAGIGYNLLAAETMRTDDNANVLCLAGSVLQPDFARAIVRKFLDTEFSNDERHIRRLEMVAKLEV